MERIREFLHVLPHLLFLGWVLAEAGGGGRCHGLDQREGRSLRGPAGMTTTGRSTVR
jgi:hypothetical protein